MVASIPVVLREGDARPEVAIAFVRRDGSVADWDSSVELVSGWPAPHARARNLTELVAPLDPPEMPDLRGFTPGTSWSGLVGLAGFESEPPRPLLAELAAVPGREELRLTLSPAPDT